MKNLVSFVVFFVLSFLTLEISCVADAKSKQVYVVYMGSSDSSNSREFILQNHVDILSSVLEEEEDAHDSLIHSYGHALSGFAAYLSKDQAAQISNRTGVVSVFVDQKIELHTTHSWEFLQAESGISTPAASGGSADTIIGMLDTGIWPESPSFSDGGLGPIPAKWKGVCMESADFKCNRKIIGARYYKSTHSAKDTQGHGTHTASTAAGAQVEDAGYYGLAKGIAKGGSPSSRIAVYRVCSEEGCFGSDILAGIDDAVNDGVDVISVSLGSASVFQTDYLADPIAIGAFHATQKGVLMVCSAGNDGPDVSSVVNTAPWILTVAAATTDRHFESDIILGNGKILLGEAINFSNLSKSDMVPLVSATDVASNTSSIQDASNCYPASLDPEKARGKIVVCLNSDATVSRKLKKAVVQSAEGRGMVLVDDVGNSIAFNYGSFPLTSVSDKTGSEILSYIKSSKEPVATILKTTSMMNQKPAPVVAYFSSRGPGGQTENILKPDITAPGVNILAAWVPANRSSDTPAGDKPSYYSLVSGTSMACPHVSGTAALVKSFHPTWTASTLRSALITSVTFGNNVGGGITKENGKEATPFDIGAGLLSPPKAINPGLTYETTTEDYLWFLCAVGYKQSQILAMSGNKNFTCPSNAKGDESITDMNYPSIAIAKLVSERIVKRTLSNMGSGAGAEYEVTVETPSALTIKVSPMKLVFNEETSKVTYSVSFTASPNANKGYAFGSLTWSDGKHSVRTPFVVNVS